MSLNEKGAQREEERSFGRGGRMESDAGSEAVHLGRRAHRQCLAHNVQGRGVIDTNGRLTQEISRLD